MIMIILVAVPVALDHNLAIMFISGRCGNRRWTPIGVAQASQDVDIGVHRRVSAVPFFIFGVFGGSFISIATRAAPGNR
jgi:hypothetical protein